MPTFDEIRRGSRPAFGGKTRWVETTSPRGDYMVFRDVEGDPIVLTKANAYRKVVEWDAETDTNRYGHETLVKMDRPEALRAIFACGFYETRIKESRERGIIKARELAA